jgi:Peptidoglycan-synthase activator LpoB
MNIITKGQIMKNSRFLLCAASLSFLALTGCNSEGPGRIGSHNVNFSEKHSEAVVLDTSLMPGWFKDGKLSFENNRSRKIADGKLLRVYAELRNRLPNKPLDVELSTSFRKNGNVVDESRWEKFRLAPNHTLTYKVNSLEPADTYCVRIRMSKKFTNDINGAGINLMADKTLRSLVNCPVIRRTKTPVRITLHQFDNRSNLKFDESIFLSKLRAEANSRTSDKFIFVARQLDIMDAVEEERQAKREGTRTADKSKTKNKLSGVSYFLTGKLHTLPGKNYCLFSYQLIDAENSDIVWEDQFETGNY